MPIVDNRSCEMPQYNLKLHDDLAPHLEKFPGLFGLYPENSNANAGWDKDTSMTTQPYRHARSFCARIQKNSGVPDRGIVMGPEHRPAPWNMSYLSKSNNCTEDDWFHLENESVRPGIRRSGAISRRHGRRSHAYQVVPRAMAASQRPSSAQEPFGSIDELLVHVSSVIEACFKHLESSHGEVSIPIKPLPQRLSMPLTALYVHFHVPSHDMNSNTCDTVNFDFRRQDTEYPVVSHGRPPHVTTDIPSPLGSHPSQRYPDGPMAGRFRALRRIGRHLGHRKNLVPSLIALLTAQTFVSRLAKTAERRLTDLTQETRRRHRYNWDPDALDPYGIPIERRTVDYNIAGSGQMLDKKPLPSNTYYYPRPSHTAAYSSDHRMPENLFRGPVRETERKRELMSKWSPWSPASSVDVNDYSRNSSEHPLYSFHVHRNTRASSIFVDTEPLEYRMKKLHIVVGKIDLLLKLTGVSIWTSDSDVSRETRIRTMEKEIERCKALLVEEGFLS